MRNSGLCTAAVAAAAALDWRQIFSAFWHGPQWHWLLSIALCTTDLFEWCVEERREEGVCRLQAVGVHLDVRW